MEIVSSKMRGLDGQSSLCQSTGGEGPKEGRDEDRIELKAHLFWQIWKYKNECVYKEKSRPEIEVINQLLVNGWDSKKNSQKE